MSSSVDAPTWPGPNFSAVPYEVYTDPEFYRIEMDRLFRGPVWHYLTLDVEIPNSGDYRTTWLGEINVIVVRDEDGNPRAFENTCAHRGARIVDELHGNTQRFACPYHLWNYSLDGRLVGVPLEKGLKGKGGMPSCFDKRNYSLKALRIARYGGMIFGTFSPDTVPIEDYLGATACEQIERLLVQRKPKVLGYLRQRIPGNWKLYTDNVRDPYHGSLLHLFQVSFGIQQPTMRGGVKFDAEGKNCWNHSLLSDDDQANQAVVREAYAGTDKFNPEIEMADPSVVQVPLDLPDKIRTTILSIFPTLIVAQVDNTYAIRHLRPKGHDLVELHITYLGFEDDDEKRHRDKLTTVNLIGPAGYISMEDGEALRRVQEGVKASNGRHSVVAMGGTDAVEDADYLSHEIAIRGFWAHYHKLMELPAAGEGA
jgi:anthranilate 1,2-dioxygenase large subunit